ncbi:MAG TPA: iron-containing alcohol dehydrogenase [Polyangia bacterium]|nr:iron-containing alcohol dehydrogenase [Polyangia bacterium]
MKPDLQFNFYQPTRVIYGCGSVRDLSLEAKRLGVERAVVVTDQILREKTDLVGRVERALGARCAGVYDGVIPDTAVEVIDRGAAFARARGCDGLVSLGGGSSIDTAKGMAIVLTEGGSIRDHQGSQALGRRQMTHLAIPTTAGTGSEVSQYAVVKDHEAHEKMHYADDHIVPDLALLDPELTVGMPPLLTAATGLDALTHAIEAYTAINRNPMADALALAAIRLIARHLEAATTDGKNLAARGGMLIAANLAGMAFNASGVGLVHAMAHVVGARYGVHHGTANAICLPHVMRFNNDELSARYRDVALALGVDVRGLEAEAAGLQAADRVAQLNAHVGLPQRLREVGVPAEELLACAEQSLSDGAIVYNGKFAADQELVLGVYRAAY